MSSRESEYRPEPPAMDRLAVHTITTKPWPIETAVPRFAAVGVRGITVWRDALEGRNPAAVGTMIREAGLTAVALCRGGFIASRDDAQFRDALDDNRRAIDEAAAVGAPRVVMVVGADPAWSLADSRRRITEGLAVLAEYAAEAKTRLLIEPLHPMYADTRSAINTLETANDVAEAIASPWVTIAVDVYHLWWDPHLSDQIERCGRRGNLDAFHVCDWRSPTRDLLNDRGLMGEGCIDIPTIRRDVERAGFDGFVEVEIFSTEYWSTDQDTFLKRIVDAYRAHV